MTFVMWLADKVGSVLVFAIMGGVLLLVQRWLSERTAKRLLGGLAPLPPAATFTCPQCGGHCFGSSRDEGADPPERWLVHCQTSSLDGRGGCGFSGPYKDYVKTDPSAGIATVTAEYVAVQQRELADMQMREALEQERDCRWLRFNRLTNDTHDAGAAHAQWLAAEAAFDRARRARNLPDLMALDAEAKASS